MRDYKSGPGKGPLFLTFTEINNMTYTTNAFAHGIGNSAVSSQWFNRPDDQKFLTLDDMLAHKKIDS